jgi:hypothetical protein
MGGLNFKNKNAQKFRSVMTLGFNITLMQVFEENKLKTLWQSSSNGKDEKNFSHSGL